MLWYLPVENACAVTDRPCDPCLESPLAPAPDDLLTVENAASIQSLPILKPGSISRPYTNLTSPKTPTLPCTNAANSSINSCNTTTFVNS